MGPAEEGLWSPQSPSRWVFVSAEEEVVCCRKSIFLNLPDTDSGRAPPRMYIDETRQRSPHRYPHHNRIFHHTQLVTQFPNCGLAAHATGVERTAQPHTTHSSSTGVEGRTGRSSDHRNATLRMSTTWLIIGTLVPHPEVGVSGPMGAARAKPRGLSGRHLVNFQTAGPISSSCRSKMMLNWNKAGGKVPAKLRPRWDQRSGPRRWIRTPIRIKKLPKMIPAKKRGVQAGGSFRSSRTRLI